MAGQLQDEGANTTSSSSTTTSVQKRPAHNQTPSTTTTTTMGSLEVELPSLSSLAESDHRRFSPIPSLAGTTNKRQQQRSSPKQKRKMAIVRYLFLSSVASILTTICPGHTIFWKNSMYYTIQILLVYVLVLLSFFNLQGSDPGFILTDDEDENDDLLEDGLALLGANAMDDKDGDEDESNKQNNVASTTTTTSTSRNAVPSPPPPPLAEEEFGDFGSSITPVVRLYSRKPCDLCHLARPPLRSHHCKVCDRCVASFDHHCGFLDTCIGERNHIRFWIFVLLNVIAIRICCKIVGTSDYGMTTMLFKSNKDDEPDHNALVLLSAAVVLIKIYLYAIYFAAHILFVIHTYLILANKTTFEINIGSDLDYMRDTQPMDCIFSQGCLENIKLQCLLDDGLLLLRNNNNPPRNWSPMIWKRPKTIVRDSEDWWNHPWQNKYWRCC
eukprot:scaffold497_cov97-Cylindrotheca_fusiformis.AAC.5